MLEEFELNCTLSPEAGSQRDNESFIIEARKLKSQNKPLSSSVIFFFGPGAGRIPNPLSGDTCLAWACRLAGWFGGVFGKLQTEDGLKVFSDHPLWRCSKEEMPGDMNMLSSLLLITITDQISKGWSLTLQSCSSKRSPLTMKTETHCISIFMESA